MARVFKWLMRITGGVLVLALIAGIVIYILLSRSLPDYDKTLQVDGISDQVTIIRDNANVPHIFGESDPDVFFALGYAHAQDRLWQMTMLRRTAQGRLSELFGTRTVAVDKLLRRFALYKAAQRSVQVQDAYTKAALAAYAKGVNARLVEINDDALGRGAPEMFVFNAPVAPWQPADSLAIIKLMAVQLSSHLENEVLLARLMLALDDPERVEDLIGDNPGPGIAALPEYAALYPGHRFQQAALEQTPLDDPLSPFKSAPFAGASNAWAAAPGRSAAGGALLANDPHLGFTAPSIWYLARLELSSGGVIGATIPGVPTIMAGRSARLGWGITSSYLDEQDVYIEALNPDDPSEYRTPDGFKKFRSEKSILRIKDADPVTLTLLWTENGPVLPGSHYDLAEITPENHVTSLAWTALSSKDTSMSAAIALMRAGTIEEALKGAERFIAPSQNLTLVDQDSIAMKTIGAMPRRRREHQTEGRMPSPGWREENRWQGMLPYSVNPEFIAPKGGIVGNTNNKMIDRPFPLHVSHKWGDSQRIHRWRKLMQERKVHTRESFIDAQLDIVSFTARSLLPLIARELLFNWKAASDGTHERLRHEALELLSGWNGEMYEYLPEPLIYAAWLKALNERLIRDELGPLADEFAHANPLFIERVYRDKNGASEWCDIRQSTKKETCTEIARLALDDALVWITEKYGTALESLQWGEVHQAMQDHPVLGEVPILKYFVNIRQSTSGGDNTLQRGLTKGTGENPFLNIHGAGYRGVYDFADPDSSVFIISTGQSGHFLSRYYDNLAQLWRRGEYIPMSLDPALARAAATGITVLKPGGGES